MTPIEAAARVAEIEAAKADFEHAHSLEDRLYIEVLSTIAAGSADDPAELARVALRANGISFRRVTA